MKRIYNFQTVLPHILIGLLLIFVAYMGSAQIPESIGTSANDIGKSYTAGTRIITGLPKYFPDTVKNETLFAMDKNNNRLFTWNPKSSRWEVDKIRGNSSSTPRMEVLNSLVFDYTNTILQDSNNFKYYRWDLTANIWNTGLNGSDTIPHTVVTKNFADNNYKYQVLPTVNSMMYYAGNATTVTITDSLRGGIFNLTTLTGNVVDSGVVFPSAISGYVWKRDVSNTDGIKVDWYIGTGEPSIAINRAILNSPNYTKTKIIFNTKTYNIYNSIILRGGLIFTGDGINTTIKTQTDVDAFKVDTLTYSKYTSYFTIQDMNIVGSNNGDTSIHGSVSAVNVTSGNNYDNRLIILKNLNVSNFKGNGFNIINAFTFTMDNCQSSFNGKHAFYLYGQNTTVLKNCYASVVAKGYAGYRILEIAKLISCNGVDKGDNWGIFGDNAGYEGTVHYPRVTLENCNIEAFEKNGIVYANSPIVSAITNCSFISVYSPYYAIVAATRPDNILLGTWGRLQGLSIRSNYLNLICTNPLTGTHYLYGGYADQPPTFYRTGIFSPSYTEIIHDWVDNFAFTVPVQGENIYTAFLTNSVYNTNQKTDNLLITNSIGINVNPSYKLDVNAYNNSAGNPIRLQGLLQGAITDSIVSDSAGVLKRLSILQITNTIFVDTLITTSSNLSLTKYGTTINNGSSAITLTIPTGLPAGYSYKLKISDSSTGVITIASSENVFKSTLTSSSITNGAGGIYDLIKNSAGFWNLQ